MASAAQELTITADYYSIATGELDKAAQTFQKEIESYPREPIAYNRLGIVFSLRGQYEKAAESTRQAERLAPGNVSWYVNLAYYAISLQRFDEARQVLKEAQARGLDHFYMHNALYALAFLGGDSAAMTQQQKWYAGETISLGIGQGYNSFTPLQLAHAVANLANNGVVFLACDGAILRHWSLVRAEYLDLLRSVLQFELGLT